jgi:hypothetical protein
MAEPPIHRFLSAPANRRVLFVSYGAGHIMKVSAVFKVLQERGYACLVLAMTIGYSKAQQLNLEPVGYRDFLHLVDAEHVLAVGAGLLKGNEHPDVDGFESACYLGINYLELKESLGELEANAHYLKKGRGSFFPLCFFKRLMNYLQPAVVVATSSPRSEQAAIEAAVSCGIPSLTMVDFIPPSDPFMSRTVHADCITVAADFIRDELIAKGVSPARVVVTGSPDFDALFDPEFTEAADTKRAALGWYGLNVILWAGYIELLQGNFDPAYAGTGLGLAVEKHLRAWVARHPHTALVIRYHPGQYHEFPDLGEQERVYYSNPITDPLVPLLHLSDSVVVQASTVGFEAAALGKNVLTLGFAPSVEVSDFDYSRFGLGLRVDGWQALDEELSRLSGAAKPLTSLSCISNAASRVADEVEALLL